MESEMAKKAKVTRPAAQPSKRAAGSAKNKKRVYFFANGKADARTAVDHVAGGKPGAGLIDGEGGADAVFRIADLHQHSLVERIGVGQDNVHGLS